MSEDRHWVHPARIQFPPLINTGLCCQKRAVGSLGQWHHLSKPQLSHLENGYITPTSGVYENESSMNINFFAHSRWPINDGRSPL